jgi:hypothetical protein
MALGPDKITLTREDMERVGTLEKQIDGQLRTRYSGGRFCMSITTSHQRDQTDTEFNGARVREELRKRYLEAGWKKVEFHDDQRDGESIILTS